MGAPKAVSVNTAENDATSSRRSLRSASNTRTTNGESAPYRNVETRNGLMNTPPGVATLHEILEHAVKHYGSKNGLGYRDIIDTHIEEKEVSKQVDGKTITEKKKWTFYELSPFKWLTYQEVFDCSKAYGAGLIALGLQPTNIIMIYGKTSVNWMLTAHAAFFHNITISTAYDNLGLDGLTHSINETESRAIFADDTLLASIKKILPNTPSLSIIIVNGTIDDTTHADFEQVKPGIKLVQIEDVMKLGRETPIEPTCPKPEDTACIMYTSGSTGQPKGVVLTHANVVGGAAGAYSIVNRILDHNDTYLAYLPLAHILEFVVEFIAQYCGLALGYGSVRTLTDISVRKCKGDIRELAPDVMTGVPAVWETIRKGILSKVNEASALKRSIFKSALAMKWGLLKLGFQGEILDKIAFKAIKEMTGGNLRFALSGGAPISPETQQFMTTCLCPILQGYGLTETVGMGCIQLPTSATDLGNIGPPTSAVEIKLVAVSETAYSPDNKPYPQGELWIRGAPVMKEYYRQPELTRESLTEDGWFKTGDIGEVGPDGVFTIIDRKKNIVKLSNGEYVALEKLEARFKSSQYVNQVLVYADPSQAFIVALVNPLEKAIPELAAAAGLDVSENVHPDEICESKKVEQVILDDFKRIAAQNGLFGAEIVANVRVLAELWTPERNYLTAAQKLRRHYIVEQEQAKLDEMFKEGRRV